MSTDVGNGEVVSRGLASRNVSSDMVNGSVVKRDVVSRDMVSRIVASVITRTRPVRNRLLSGEPTATGMGSDPTTRTTASDYRGQERDHPGRTRQFIRSLVNHRSETAGRSDSRRSAVIERDRKSTRLNSSHVSLYRMPSSA